VPAISAVSVAAVAASATSVAIIVIIGGTVVAGRRRTTGCSSGRTSLRASELLELQAMDVCGASMRPSGIVAERGLLTLPGGLLRA